MIFRATVARWKKRLSTALLYLILAVIASFGVFPFIWLLSASFKDQQELYMLSPSLIPHHPILDNYQYVLGGLHGGGRAGGGSQLLLLYKNSIVVTLSCVALTVLITSLAGYAFARLRFKGRDLVFSAFIVMMFLPAAGTLMAQYELMRNLHLRNSLLGLILLYTAGGGIPLFLMRQVFLGIPTELEDAAKIDGASDLRICFQIMMPLATSGMIVVAIMQFVGVWGEYLLCRTMIDSADKMTLPYGIGTIIFATPAVGITSSYGVAATSTLFMVVPVLLVFILLQKWFIRGAVEGLKI